MFAEWIVAGQVRRISFKVEREKEGSIIVRAIRPFVGERGAGKLRLEISDLRI